MEYIEGPEEPIDVTLDLLNTVVSQPWVDQPHSQKLLEIMTKEIVDRLVTDPPAVSRQLFPFEVFLMRALRQGGFSGDIADEIFYTSAPISGDDARDRGLGRGEPRQDWLTRDWGRIRKGFDVELREPYPDVTLAQILPVGLHEGYRQGFRPSRTKLAVGRMALQGVEPRTELSSASWRWADALVRTAGYVVVWEGDEFQGSTWKSFLFRGGKRAAKNIAAAAATAAQDSYIRTPGAVATKELAAAAGGLITSLGNREGAFVFDNLLVAQYRTGSGELRSLCLELNLEQRRIINRNPAVMARPGDLLVVLGAIEDHPPELNAPE
jgi:hypothetical protein